MRSSIFVCFLGLICLFSIALAVDEDESFQAMLYDNPLLTDIDYDQGYVIGQIKINGNIYDAYCDCDSEDPSGTDHSSLPLECDPSKIKLVIDQAGEGATVEEVKNLIGNPSSIPYTKILENPFYCVDSRLNQRGLFTPGGDAGEFILALSQYQSLMEGRELTVDDIKAYLESYLSYMNSPTFVMCTDDEAINHIETDIGAEGINIHNPREALQQEVLSKLLKYDNTGDSHMRLLMKYPDMYQVQHSLVQNFVEAFYSILWDKTNSLSEKLELVVNVGVATPSAFLEVRTNQGCLAVEMAPLIKPRGTGSTSDLQIFVNHLDAVAIKRYDLAQFFTSYITTDLNVELETFYNHLNHHGLMWLQTTGNYIAKTLPFMTLELV